MRNYPCVRADLEKILFNINRAADLCHSRGIAMAAVAKCVSADPVILRVIEDSRCDWIADSRVDNFMAMDTKKPRFLIRIPQLWEAGLAVEHSDISLQSEISVIERTGREAAARGLRHKVMLICDMGDLREGCFFEDREDIFRTAEAILRQPSLEFYGLAMNLGDFGGVLPCPENMNGLTAIADELRTRYGIGLPVVSGGASLMIHDLLRGTVAPGINHLRIGELWLAGHDPGRNADIEGFHTDCFTLSAQLVEVKHKPSKPIGPIGGDAFGHVVEHPDEGPMLRGILAVGKQDIDPEFLRPTDPRVRILGASSDHTVVDLTAAPEYAAGDVLSFSMGYGAILRAYTGHYVKKEYTGLEQI